MRKFKRLTLTLALLLMAVGGAWADETPLLTIESKDYTSFTSGSKTFDDMVTVTFSNPVYYDGEEGWWYAGGDPSLLTVAGINGYTITSCKFYTGYGYAQTGYPVEGESPSVYLYGGFVFNDASQSVTLGYEGVTKIEVYGTAPAAEPTEWSLTPDETGKTWTLAKMPASNVELQVEYEPTKVTMAANDNAMGTVEVAGQTKVEWTADTWKGWNYDTKEYTVGDITMTSSKKAYIRESTEEGKYKNSLSFGVIYSSDESTVTFSTTGDPFSRIEFTMIDDYSESNPNNPHILPLDNWTFSGKSAVWEGEATKSLTLQSCSTNVSKITFYKGFAIPDGVTINGDGTFTVAKTATVTLKATPAEGYKFLYWEDDQNNTNPVREVTIESGMADKTYKAVFAEILYNVTFVEGTNLDEWSATPATEVKKDAKVDIKYTGPKKVIGVKVEEKKAGAEGHALSASAVGEIVGSDGKAYAADDKDNLPEGVTVAAKVCYVDGNGHGLALALTDEVDKMNWSTAQTTCDAHTPAITGGKWMLASKGEWNNMISAAGSYSALRDGFSSVGGTNMESGGYWSSTEDDSSDAWNYYFSNGLWSDVSKNWNRCVRACLAF